MAREIRAPLDLAANSSASFSAPTVIGNPFDTTSYGLFYALETTGGDVQVIVQKGYPSNTLHFSAPVTGRIHVWYCDLPDGTPH